MTPSLARYSSIVYRLKAHNGITIRSRRQSNSSQITNKLNSINLVGGKTTADEISTREAAAGDFETSRTIVRGKSEGMVHKKTGTQKDRLETQPQKGREQNTT